MCADPAVEKDRAVFEERDPGRGELATVFLSPSTKTPPLTPLRPLTPWDSELPGDGS